VPMTIQMESNRLKRRGSSDVCGVDVAGAFNPFFIARAYVSVNIRVAAEVSRVRESEVAALVLRTLMQVLTVMLLSAVQCIVR
jgi:hypothetical protein